MYNLLIVDDEKGTRELVSQYLEEELSEDFYIYSADSGLSALEIMSDINIDIVVTDIMMQKMNGIELAENIYRNYKNCIVIIMSGYDEFEYAQKAIRYSVREYLLKPFDMDYLCEKIRTLKNELVEKHSDKISDNIEELEEERERFFVNLVYGGLGENEEEIEKANLILPFDLKNTPCDIIFTEIEDYENFITEKWSYEKDALTVAINNLFSGYLKNQYVYLLHSEDGSFEFIVYHNGDNTDYADLTRKISAIANINIVLSGEPLRFSNIKELIDYRKKNTNSKERALLFISHLKEKNYDDAKKILVSASENKETYGEFKAILREYGLPFEIEEFSENEVFKDDINTENTVANLIITVENAKKYIQENYSRNISREDVAKAVFISPAYFTRNFKIYTGENFSDYLLKIRMHNAVELMKKRKYKVEEIAEMVGYENQKYFYRVFKMYFGYTPKEYMIRVLGQSDNQKGKQV